MKSVRAGTFLKMAGFSALVFGSVFVGIQGVNAQGNAGSVILVPHRATYDLTMATASGRSGIVAITGRMAYEFTGAVCEGFTVNLRIVTKFTDNDRKVSLTDVRTSSWESGKGARFRFSSTHFLNNRKTQVTQGSATGASADSVGKASIETPVKKKFDMPKGTLFPTAHLRETIERALKGENVFPAPLFDGGDSGKIYRTTSFIGRPKAAGSVKLTGKMTDEVRKSVEALQSWPVNISYFEGKDGVEETPVFEFAFDLFANGIAGKVLIDYGDFSLKGRLNSLELLEKTKC